MWGLLMGEVPSNSDEFAEPDEAKSGAVSRWEKVRPGLAKTGGAILSAGKKTAVVVGRGLASGSAKLWRAAGDLLQRGSDGEADEEEASQAEGDVTDDADTVA